MRSATTTTQKLSNIPSSQTLVVHQLSLEGRRRGFTSPHMVLFIWRIAQ
jgi:hypothetical protein